MNCTRRCDGNQVSEILDASGGDDEVLVVEQTEQLIVDDNETATEDLMPRSSPDGSTDNDVDDEQHGYLLTCSLICISDSNNKTNSIAAPQAIRGPPKTRHTR